MSNNSNTKTNKTLVLFDFDGTITVGDSYLQFIIFSVGIPRFIWGILLTSPYILLYTIKLLSNAEAKQRVTKNFFQGWDEKIFHDKSKQFVEQRLDGMLRKEMVEKIIAHKNSGHDIYVVSASFEEYLQYWTDKMGIQLIGTRLETLQGKLTGHFKTLNCHGPQKVLRIQGKIDLSQYAKIIAYGDSKGDREMLGLAQEKYYKGIKL